MEDNKAIGELVRKEFGERILSLDEFRGELNISVDAGSHVGFRQ